jgi:hypothetical protein
MSDDPRGAQREPTELEVPLDQQPLRASQADAAHASTQLPAEPALPKKTITQWKPPASATQQTNLEAGNVSGTRPRAAGELGPLRRRAAHQLGRVRLRVPRLRSADQ